MFRLSIGDKERRKIARKENTKIILKFKFLILKTLNFDLNTLKALDVLSILNSPWFMVWLEEWFELIKDTALLGNEKRCKMKRFKV